MIELSLLQVAGTKASDFLQGQLTCDMRAVIEPQKTYLGAICNNKGRVIASLGIHKTLNDDSNSVYHLSIPTELIEKVLKHLKKYAVFSDVNIDIVSHSFKQINLLETIRKKTAVILDETSEKFTPHELNYHNLGFISFDKGCYKGQEIIARMHYLGKLKKKLQHVQCKTIEEMKALSADWPENKVNIACTETEQWEALLLLPANLTGCQSVVE